MEQPDYLTYKKLKQQYKFDNTKPRKVVKAKFFLRFFILTFLICFVFILILAGQYTARMDIEYDDNNKGLDVSSPSDNVILDNFKVADTDEKSSIDRRLVSLYNEEIGLSTARAVNREEEKPIDSEHYEKIKSEQFKVMEEKPQTDSKGEALQERTFPLTPEQQQQMSPVKLIHTKILIGKYRSLDDAKKVQEQIRRMPEFNSLTPFVRKIGDIYTIQVGSYTNLELAKSIADKFSRAGYGVWIVQ